MLDFKETDLGYNEEESLNEAKRCLGCKKPLCETGCPAGLPIRDYIKLLKEGQLADAAKIISEKSLLPSICSIVCPHEKQCVGHCVLNAKQKPINVGKLERYIIENTKMNYPKEALKNYKVAIIGGGPAGISCALELAKKGIDVTIFEKDEKIGGVMTYGIPEFRLQYAKVEKLVNELLEYGVNIKTNSYLKYEEIIELKKDFDKIFIASGLPSAKKLGIPNENAENVYDALELLRNTNIAVKLKSVQLPKLMGVTCVVGAGNVAVDAARVAKRLGSKEVYIVYRRTLEESPACKHELDEALKEGIKFLFLTNPVEVLIDNNKVSGLKCEVMILGDRDASGRARPIGSGDFKVIDCDNVIQAIGQSPDEGQKNTKLFNLDHGYFVTNDDLETSVVDIYAGGDIVLGASTVVKAMVQGREVAKRIIEDLSRI